MIRRSHGQGMVEYALIILLIALVVVAALALIGPRVATIFSGVAPNL
jgi:pilus assembly protein Flp/PilA